jgi:hypothetical protein
MCFFNFGGPECNILLSNTVSAPTTNYPFFFNVSWAVSYNLSSPATSVLTVQIIYPGSGWGGIIWGGNLYSSLKILIFIVV